MAANLGTLTLDLVAKIGGFIGPMDKASRESQKRMGEIKKSAEMAGKAIGAASVVAAGAMAVWIKSSINQAAEIENLARLAGASTTEFQRFAVGAKTVGIENDKLSDILKDVNDKVGDFLVTGGGPMADFFEKVAPLVGVTADQFRGLSGPDALGLYVDTLEKAGASEQELTFFMEAIASDATALIPLLKDSGREMGILADEAQGLGLILSDETVKGAKQFNSDLALLGKVANGVGQQIAADLLPELTNLTNELRDPATIKAAADMAKAVVGSFTSIIDGARNTVQFIQWAAESAAAFMGGIAADDLVRLNDEIERLEQMKASGALDRLVFFGRDGIASYYNDEELDAELVKLRAAVEAAMQGSNPITIPLEPKMTSGGSAAGPGLNLGGEASKEAAKAAEKAASAIRKQIDALQLKAETVGMAAEQEMLYKLQLEGATEAQLRQAEAALQTVSSYEKQVEAVRAMNEAQEETNREAISIMDSLLSEEEQIEQSYERRRQIILDNTLVTGEAQGELLRQLEEKKNEDLLEINGSYWEQYLLAAEENLQSFDELSGVMLENFTGRFGDAFESMVFDAESLGDAVQGLAEGMARSIVNALGQMAAQWVAYQAVQMLVGKTTQASAANTLTFNALASQQMAAINAFASTAAIPLVGPLMAPAAAAAAIAATSPMVGAVASLSLAGMAHEGIDSIPQTGTWLLEKGERVTTAETSAKLDKTLSDIEQGGSGAPIVNLYEDSAKAGQVNSRQEDGKNVIDIFVADIMSDGKSSKAISRAFGVQRSGT